MKSLENLPDEVKAEILKELEESYVSKEEFTKVKTNSQVLLDEVKQTKRSKAEIEAAAEQARLEAAAKNGDIESLKTSYEQKLSFLNEQITQYNEEKRSTKVNTVSSDFINSSFVDDAFIREAATKEFAKRLDVRDGDIVVLDANGNLTANTVDDLKQEFITNQKYAKHIVGSRANGGGALPSGKTDTTTRTKNLANIPLTDKAARLAAIRSKLNT